MNLDPCHYSQSNDEYIQSLVKRETKNTIVRSSLKSATWLPLSWTRRRPPCDTWHSSFHPDGNHRSLHPDVSHQEFFPPRHSTRMSHTRNSSSPTFHPDVSHPESFSANFSGCLTSGILSGRRSNFSGCLTSGILSCMIDFILLYDMLEIIP